MTRSQSSTAKPIGRPMASPEGGASKQGPRSEHHDGSRRDRRSPARDGRSQDRSRGRATPGGKRHQARIVALQVLYETDLTDHPVSDVLERTFADQAFPANLHRHVERLVYGSLTERERIDGYVAAAAPAFPVAQLASVDRNVLRLAIYELLSESDVPAKVAINEAVELAKRFGGANSGRFVNGVLGTVAERVAADRSERQPADDGSASTTE